MRPVASRFGHRSCQASLAMARVSIHRSGRYSPGGRRLAATVGAMVPANGCPQESSTGRFERLLGTIHGRLAQTTDLSSPFSSATATLAPTRGCRSPRDGPCPSTGQSLDWPPMHPSSCLFLSPCPMAGGIAPRPSTRAGLRRDGVGNRGDRPKTIWRVPASQPEEAGIAEFPRRSNPSPHFR